MAKKKIWASGNLENPKHKVPENFKMHVQEKSNFFIESELKREHIKPPPKDEIFNYIVDIYSKWYKSYFYFYAKYHCSARNSISDFFEIGVARLEYVGNEHFNLSYMRHTGQWQELYSDLSLDECLENIRNDPHFFP